MMTTTFHNERLSPFDEPFVEKTMKNLVKLFIELMEEIANKHGREHFLIRNNLHSFSILDRSWKDNSYRHYSFIHVQL